jgi:hypothetical protein
VRALILVGVCLSSTAVASPFTDALKKHSAADVTALRSQLADPAARCTLGAVYSQRDDLSRAALYLDGCLGADLPDDIGPEIRKHARAIGKKLASANLTELAISTTPDGMTLTLPALEGEAILSPHSVWVKAGTHTITATEGDLVMTTTIIAEAGKRAPVFMVAPPKKQEKEPGVSSVDFTEENAIEKQTEGPPPAVKHKSLIRGKYAGVGEAPSGDEIADPLAVRASHGHARADWLGVRVGGGITDMDATDAQAGGAIAAVGRFGLPGPWFVAARADYSKRAVSMLGAAAGMGVSLVRTDALDVAAIAQLRGELRLGDVMERFGAGVTAGFEVAPLATPITVGVRAEQGLSETGSRAFFVELGLDWR